MEDPEASLAIANRHFDNGDIKDAYNIFLTTAQNVMKPLFDVKFVHCSIVSKPQNAIALISILHSCVDHIEKIMEYHSASSKISPPPLPPKPNHVNKPVLPPKPSKTTSSVVPIREKPPIPTSTTMNQTALNNAGSSKKQLLIRSSSYQIDQYLNNDEPVPDGEIDPTHLVPAQTNNSDSLTPANSTVSGIGVKSDHIPHIPIPPLLTTHRVLQSKLDKLESALKDFRTQKSQLNENDEQQNQFLTDAIAKYTPYVAEAKHTLNRVRTLYMSAGTIPSILHFQPGLVAYQLTHIESAIFLAIPLHALLTHTAKTPHPRVVASSDFFNYVTRLIEHSILLPQEASARAQHINHWIKVASKCQDLNNYQTLKAIVSALGTPPVQRLKRTWAYIPKKSLSRLESMNELMSETNNYGKYREHMGIVTTSVLHGKSVNLIQSEHYKRPTVPFLGTFIHDMTYLLAAVQQQKGNSNNVVADNGVPSIPLRTSSRQYGGTSCSPNLHQDPRINKLLEILQKFHATPPYDRRPNTKMIISKTQNQVRPALSQAIHRSKSSFGRLGGAIGFGNASGDNSSETMPNYTQYCSTEEFDIEEQQSLVTQYILMRSWVSQNTVDELSQLREPPNAAMANHGKHIGRTSSITSSMMSNTSSLMRLSNHSPATSSTLTLTSSMDSCSRPASMDDDIHGRSYIYGRCSALTAPLTSSSTLDDDDDYQHSMLSREGITSSTKFWNDPVINLYNKDNSVPIVPPRPTATTTSQPTSFKSVISQKIAHEAIASRQAS